MRNYCDRAGAAQIAQAIEAYWASRGLKVTVRLERGTYTPSMRCSRVDVRSDMENGFPAGLTAMPAPPPPPPCPAEPILKAVAKKHGLTVEALKGRQQTRKVSHARFEAYARLYDELGLTLIATAALFGKKDHSAVSWGIQRFKEMEAG